MKPIKAQVLSASIAMIVAMGCRSPEITPISGNTYVISAYSAFNGTSQKDLIIQKANEFAKSKGKVAVAISIKESHPPVGLGGNFEYQFMLVDKDEVDFTKISIGMTKEQVIEKLGKPTRMSVIGGLEYLEYEAYDSHQRPLIHIVRDNYDYLFVRIINGKVDAFGRKGDFDTTKNPTNDININQKVTTKTNDATQQDTTKFDLTTELKKLEQLKKDGLVTKQEYESLRQRAIDKAKAQ